MAIYDGYIPGRARFSSMGACRKEECLGAMKGTQRSRREQGAGRRERRRGGQCEEAGRRVKRDGAAAGVATSLPGRIWAASCGRHLPTPHSASQRPARGLLAIASRTAADQSYPLLRPPWLGGRRQRGWPRHFLWNWTTRGSLSMLCVTFSRRNVSVVSIRNSAGEHARKHRCEQAGHAVKTAYFDKIPPRRAVKVHAPPSCSTTLPAGGKGQ